MKRYFDVILIALMFMLMATVANGQAKCPNLEVTNIGYTSIPVSITTSSRIKFVVTIKNITKLDYAPTNALIADF